MAWNLALGNLISRSPALPVPVGGSIDPLYPISDAGNGHPDDPVRWVWDAGGVYSADFDLNLLSADSLRADAPSGWSDLALRLAGTPGLPANPPEWGTFAGRPDTLKVYGASFQDVDVLPGEDVKVKAGIYRPAASDATGVRVIVLNLSNGKQADGALNVWNDSSTPLAEQTTDDTWLDFEETLVSDSTERVTYRVIVMPLGGSGANFYVYINEPSLTAAQDFVALIGHNIPAGAVVEWDDGTITRTLTPEQPSFFGTGTASTERDWSLTITMPANTKAWTAAPFFGELWAGRLITMTACPGYPFDLTEGDLGMTRLEGGLGREDVFTQTERPNRLFKMRFKTTSLAQYENARDDFVRACRFGADPVIISPVDALEGPNTIWHGRIGPETTYARINNARRTFEITLRESPWPRFR